MLVRENAYLQIKLEEFNLISLALKAKDLKKERRKNLVPAKVGLFTLGLQITYGTIYCILYSVPIDLGKAFSIFDFSWNWLLIGVRQYFISFFNDLIHCIIHPSLIIYNSTVIRSRLKITRDHYLNKLPEFFLNSSNLVESLT